MNNNKVRLISTGIVKGSSGAKPEPQFCTCRSKDLRQQYVNLCILSVAGGRYHENIMPCLSVCLSALRLVRDGPRGVGKHQGRGLHGRKGGITG